MADLTDRIFQHPLTVNDDGEHTGDCLAERCGGIRAIDAHGTLDGTTAQVVTACGTCGRIEVEPAPGLEHEQLPGMEDADG